jgi:cell division ATPase FtsA
MIMDYEISELAGKSGESVSSDYKVLSIPRDMSQDFTVMVAMSKDQYVREAMLQLELAGVGVADILPTPLALYNALVGLGECEEGQTCLVVDIGATNTDVAIVNDKDLFFARSIGRGADDFTEALSETLAVGFPEAERIKTAEGTIATGEWTSDRQKLISDTLSAAADRLYATLNSSVSFARRQLKLKSLKIDRVILLGGGSNLPGLPEHLSRSFGVKAVAPDLYSHFKESEEPGRRMCLMQALPPGDISAASGGLREFATAIGLALSKIDPSFYAMDLVPAEEKKKRTFRERTVYLYAAGAILVVFMVVRLVATWGEHATVQSRMEKLEERVGEAQQRLFNLRKVTRENAQLKSAIQGLAKVTEPGNFLTQLLFLTRRRDITPDEIKITEMQMRDLGYGEESPRVPRVLMRGKVRSRTGIEYETVRKFLKKLLATELVKSGEIDASRTRMDKGEFKFELEVCAGRAR